MKDHIRDYATEAFRFYARWGNAETYINYLLSDLQKQKSGTIGSSTEAALIQKEMIIQEYAAELEDLEAVEKVLMICDSDVRKAVEMVYFFKPYEELEWGNIKKQVYYAEINIPASERQVYYWLKKARCMFAEERGLRLKNKIKKVCSKVG